MAYVDIDMTQVYLVMMTMSRIIQQDARALGYIGDFSLSVLI